MAEVRSILPIIPLTENEVGGDPGPRSGTVHLVPSGATPTVAAAMAVANYGDDIKLDRTVTNTELIREEWLDYAARPINASTPRQVTRSQLRRLKDVITGTEPSIEEVVRLQTLGNQAITTQAVTPQGPPSYIRVMSNAPAAGAVNGVPVLAPLPGTRPTRADRANFATWQSRTPIARGVIGRRSYRYWWFEGIRFVPEGNPPSDNDLSSLVYFLNDLGSWQSYRQFPDHFMLHRCLLDSDPNEAGYRSSVARATWWGGRTFGIVDCAAYGIYGPCRPGDPGVFQLTEDNGSMHIVNTYCEGLSSLVFSGGSGPGLVGCNVEHVLVQRTHFHKPRKWQRDSVNSGVGFPSGWTVSVAGDLRSVTRIAGETFADPSNSTAEAIGQIGGGYLMYQTTTGRGAHTAMHVGLFDIDHLLLSEDWPGGAGTFTNIHFQCASAVYNSGAPGQTNVATTVNGSATVAVTQALPATILAGVHYFYLNDTGYVGTGGHLAPIGNGPFRRKILAINGPRTQLTLSGPWNVSKTFPFSVVTWDGLDRTSAPIKSMMEYKCGRHVCVEDTIMETNYHGDWNGTGFALHPTNQDGVTKPWSETSDVRVRFVRMSNITAPLSLQVHTSNSGRTIPAGRYHIEQCLFDNLAKPDLDIPMISSTAGFQILRTTNFTVKGDNGDNHPEDNKGPATIAHISMVNSDAPAGRTWYLGGDASVPYPARDRVIRDSVLVLAGTDPVTAALFTNDALPLSNFFATPAEVAKRLIYYGSSIAPGKVDQYKARNELYGSAGLALPSSVGFIDHDGGNYELAHLYQTAAGACTVSGATVTINSGAFPTTLVKGVPFRVTADGPIAFTQVLSRDSTTQITLDRPYLGTTGSGLTGLFTFKGYASDSTVGTIHTSAAGAVTVTNITGTSQTESFTRADGAGLGSLSDGNTWSEVVGANWGITSNRASLLASGGVRHFAVSQTNLRTPDHVAQVTLGVFTNGSIVQGGVIARATANGATCYGFASVPVDGNVQIFKFTGGSYQILATHAPAAVVGDVLKLEVTGATLIGSVNGTPVITIPSDTSITSGTFAGITAFRFAGSDQIGLDTFSAQNTTALSIGLVALSSGTWPLTVAPTPTFTRTFLVSGDAASAETAIASYDSSTQIALASVYPGSTGGGLTGVVKGQIPTGKDPGCDIPTLLARQVGVFHADYTP